ncbi:hypothetical protein HanLR1_Chr09g0337181 [Helianthus annuus]|nr:hypothetical protein HanHA89_Chr09g0358081 [Helianthus annuus]KAJ0709158.1 hypothetical protein HanLR1_Chr09g0337181 [Helianthus annuus]
MCLFRPLSITKINFGCESNQATKDNQVCWWDRLSLRKGNQLSPSPASTKTVPDEQGHDFHRINQYGSTVCFNDLKVPVDGGFL